MAKNAILTITTLLENLSPRDLDPLIDIMMPLLLKKAADTNAFISGSADRALVAVS